MRNRRNYYLLLVISFLQGAVFYAPVATIYRLEYGLLLSDLFLIESVSWGVTLALEVPFGRFADRYGCRRTVLFGCGVFFVSKIVFAVAYGFSLFLAERVLLSISLAALSGAVESLLYASVKEEKMEKGFGLWNAAATAGLLTAALTAPLLYMVSLRRPAWATAVAYGVAAGLCFFLEEPDSGPGTRTDGGRSWTSLKAASLALFSDRPLVRFLVAVSLSNECVQAATVFLSQPQYERSGINPKTFGVLYALLQCSALIGSVLVGVFGRWGRKRAITGMVGIECAGAVALTFSSSKVMTIAALSAMSAAAAVIRPVFMAVQIRRIRHSDRATALSLNAMIGEFTAAAYNIVQTKIAERSLVAVFGASAVLLGSLAALSRYLFVAAEETKDPIERVAGKGETQ